MCTLNTHTTHMLHNLKKKICVKNTLCRKENENYEASNIRHFNLIVFPNFLCFIREKNIPIESVFFFLFFSDLISFISSFLTNSY